MSVVSRIFRVERGEGHTVALVASCMFVSVAGMTIGESGASALFFERVGPDSLPVMYLAQGGVGVVAMLVLSGALGRFDRRRAYVWMPVLMIGAVALERVAVATDPSWIYPVLYLTTTVAMLLQSVYLWGAAGLVTDTRGAKRLFPIFSAGNILGSVIGGLVTQPLATMIGAENLLVVWAGALLATSALCTVIVGGRRSASAPRRPRRRQGAVRELVEGFRAVRRSPLLVWMSAGSVLFSVLFYSLYLPYAQAATARFTDPDALAGFFGIFWASVTAVAFLVTVLVTNRLLGRFGAAAVVLVLPVLYGGAFGILLVTSTFVTLVAIRFGVNVWLQGVSSPAWEALTNVAPEERLDQIRAFMNGGPSQVGTAIAGIIAIVGQDALSPRQLAVIGLVTAILTLVVSWRMRRSYGIALADAIRAGRPAVFDAPLRDAPIAVSSDAQATTAVTAALTDPDARVRRVAAYLLGSVDDASARRALVDASRDADARVRAAALEGLARQGSVDTDVVTRGLDDHDPEVRGAAVLAAPVAPTTLLNDPDARVAALAAARLLDADEHTAAVAAMERLLSSRDVEHRVAVLEAIGRVRPEGATTLVHAGLADPSPLVRAAALDAGSGDASEASRDAALAAVASGVDLLVDAALRSLGASEDPAVDAALERVVAERSSAAARDAELASAIDADDDADALLRDALLARARREALVAIGAATRSVDDPASLGVALSVLRSGDRRQLANALETVEVALGPHRAARLVPAWEPHSATGAHDRAGAVDTAATHADPLIRACAELVRQRDAGGGSTMPRAIDSMTPIERVLILRRIELFSALEPADVERVARIAEERTFAAGDVIGAEGELGDELHIVVEGTVRVQRADGSTIAARRDGDVIGEMSLIRGSSRVASLIADGDVRTIRIGHREFEAMVRERPEIALAVMRVLADRLAAASGSATTE